MKQSNSNFDEKMAKGLGENMYEIARINADARDEGLSYGEYVAKYGLFHTHLKYTAAQKEKLEAKKKYEEQVAAERKKMTKENKGKLKWWEVMV